jgi:hypothetical protein
MLSLFSLTAAMLLGPAAGEESANPLFQQLREQGVAVGAGIKVPLPAPTMADGLDAKAQQAVLKAVAGEDYSLDELLRNSVVAPHILKLRDINPSDPAAPARGVDVWFIAYADLKTVTDKDFLDRLLNSNQKEGKSRGLNAAELEKRRLVIKPADEKHESYGNVVFTFLDRVEISATGHSYWSQTPDSVVFAAVLDPRFLNDADFPNQWRSVMRDPAGKTQLGPANPYDGAGYYLKFTRLAEPKGALFVEAHVVFAEPVKWFDGANLLRSKLPPVVQSQVRSVRRELIKAVP